MELGFAINDEANQLIADLIVDSMTGQWRVFHTPDHIFRVGSGGDAIEIISALFHDTVYVQIDDGVSAGVSQYISPYISASNDGISITADHHLEKDSVFRLCLMTFGFEIGQPLNPMAGQNEFLSALFAAIVLEKVLPLPVLAQVISGIEATIPFRSGDQLGSSASECLYFKLKNVNEAFGFGWHEHDIEEIIKRGVRLANRDIAGFASMSPALFLDDTWKLIPETHHQLRQADHCEMKVYREALQKMAAFLSALQPENVISRYQNEPSDEEYARLILLVKRNLLIANSYLDMKLLSIAVIEALFVQFSMQASTNILTVDLHKSDSISGDPQNIALTETDRMVLALLEEGRTRDLACDKRNSPVAIFILRTMNQEVSRNLLSQAHLFFLGELSAEGFLKDCPSKLINACIS